MLFRLAARDEAWTSKILVLIIDVIAKRAVTTGFFKPDELKIILNKGKQSVETGLCDLRRILGNVDQSKIDTSADEAISQIIYGALNIGACYAGCQKSLHLVAWWQSGAKKNGGAGGEMETACPQARG